MLEGSVNCPKHTLKSERSVDHTSGGTLLDELDVSLVGIHGGLLGVVSSSVGDHVSFDGNLSDPPGNSLHGSSLLIPAIGNSSGVSGSSVQFVRIFVSAVSKTNSTSPKGNLGSSNTLSSVNSTSILPVDSFLSSLGTDKDHPHGSLMSQFNGSDSGSPSSSFRGESPGDNALVVAPSGSPESSSSDLLVSLPLEVDSNSVITVLSFDVR